MNYLKITKYIYLIFGFGMLGLALYDWNNGKEITLTLMLAGLAFFMYFFRGRFQDRFDDPNTRGGAEQGKDKPKRR